MDNALNEKLDLSALHLGIISVGALLGAVVTLVVCILAVRIITVLLRRVLGKTTLEQRVSKYIVSTVRFVLWVVTVLIVAQQLGIPVVVIETKMEDYGAAYEKLGELLGMEDRGKELSDYCKAAYDETVSVMSKIPEGDRAKVAYLLGDKGTNTIAKNSYQGQVIDLVADNVADLGKVSGSGAGVEIGMEQLAIWDPAVILFGPDSIYDTVGSDAAFADLSAVKNGSYYKVPGTPWNWLNSPPTVNQVLGMQWLPRLLYPEQYDNDLYKTVAGYFKTFYGYDLSESEFNEIAANAQPKA